MPKHRYGATTTAAEIVADVDLHGRRAIVTGASSGIGIETARALASAGADVTLAVRNVQAGTESRTRSPKSLPPAAGDGARCPARPGRSRLGGRLRPRLDGTAAHPGQQCRRDGSAAAHPNGRRL